MTLRLMHMTPSLEFCGAVRQIELITQHASREGMASCVMSLGGPGPMLEPLQRAGASVSFLDTRPGHTPRSLVQLRRVIRQFAPDVVHSWSGRANGLGRLLAGSLSVPRIVASYRELSPTGQGWHELFERRLDGCSDAIVFNSQVARDSYLARRRIVGDSCVITNAVDVGRVQATVDRSELLARWQLPADAELIGVVGPLTRAKRIKDLIWATDLIKAIRPETYLLVIGDGPHRWRLQRFRDQVRIRDRVRFVGNQADLREWLPHLSVFWQATQRESCPNAVLEAMVAGVPVVATDHEAHRAIIKPHETGILVPVGSRADFARYAQRLLESHTLCERLTANAREYVQQAHDAKRVIPQFFELYQPGALASPTTQRL